MSNDKFIIAFKNKDDVIALKLMDNNKADKIVLGIFINEDLTLKIDTKQRLRQVLPQLKEVKGIEVNNLEIYDYELGYEVDPRYEEVNALLNMNIFTYIECIGNPDEDISGYEYSDDRMDFLDNGSIIALANFKKDSETIDNIEIYLKIHYWTDKQKEKSYIEIDGDRKSISEILGTCSLVMGDERYVKVNNIVLTKMKDTPIFNWRMYVNNKVDDEY